MADDTVLYRFYGCDDELLYVGVTMDVPSRLKKHKGERDMRSVRFIELEWFDGPSAAYAAEKHAIRREKPLWNHTHKTKRVTRKSPRSLNEDGSVNWKGRGAPAKYPVPSDKDIKYILDRWYSGDKRAQVCDDVRTWMGGNMPDSWVRDQVIKATGSAARKPKVAK